MKVQKLLIAVAMIVMLGVSMAFSATLPSFTISDPVHVPEGGTAVVTITLSSPYPSELRVAWAIIPSLVCLPAVDYLPASGTVKFLAGETVKTVTIEARQDNIVEGDETVVLGGSLLWKVFGQWLPTLPLRVGSSQVSILDDDIADLAIVSKEIWTTCEHPTKMDWSKLIVGETYRCYVNVVNNGPGIVGAFGRVSIIEQVPPEITVVNGPPDMYRSGEEGDNDVAWLLILPMTVDQIPALAARTKWFDFVVNDGILEGNPLPMTTCINYEMVEYLECHPFTPDPDLTNNCITDTRYAHTPDVDYCCNIDNTKNVGLAPVITTFRTLKPFWEDKWQYGDQTEYFPFHLYWKHQPSYDKTAYDVHHNDCMMEEFVQVYEPNEMSLTHLQVVAASPSHGDESWENAIDGDIYWSDGTASVTHDETGKPWAIFQFTDESTRKVGKIRFLNDTGLGAWSEFDLCGGCGEKTSAVWPPECAEGEDECGTFVYPLPPYATWTPRTDNIQVESFSVYVSTTGTADGDFTLLLDAAKKVTHTPCNVLDDFETYPTALTDAKYVKLVINKPDNNWRQFGEFEVYAQTTLASLAHSSITASGNPAPDGVEKADVVLTLNDADGNPISGKTAHDIELYALPKYGYGLAKATFDPIVETANPGIYTTKVASLDKGMHLILASVNGVVIDKTTPDGTEVCEVLFGQEDLATGDATGKAGSDLVLVTGTPTCKGEGWDNAVDGDLEGWNGTTSARGQVNPQSSAWAIFRFADDNTYAFNYLSIQTDNGTADDGEYSARQVLNLDVYISTTGINPGDFTAVGSIKVKTPEMAYYKLGGNYSAKYVKVVMNKPNTLDGGWRQIVEFGVHMNKHGVQLAGEEAEIAAAVLPESFGLEQNYPNPFNPTTTIGYQLPEAAHVTIKVMDVTGREVATLVNQMQNAGYQKVQFNAADLTTGVYFYTIQAGNFQDMKRMVLVK